MEGEHVKILFRHDAFEGNDIESAWAIKEGEFYKLDNILFYAKEFSWGDLVKAKLINDELYVDGLVKESGHSTVRILFENVSDVQPTRDRLKNLGCDSELSDYEKLVAVDISPSVYFSDIVKYLDEGEKGGKWEYQEACISNHHKTQKKIRI